MKDAIDPNEKSVKKISDLIIKDTIALITSIKDPDCTDLDEISYKEMLIELVNKGEKLVHLINANDASETEKIFIASIKKAKKIIT